MKYFTPDLIVRFGSDDPAIADAADADWDHLCERYQEYIDSIKPEMPPGLRHIEDSFYLHDAVLLGMGKRDSRLVMLLQLDTPPRSLLTFTYDLLREPGIDREALPPEVRSTGQAVDWQYDEIERLPGERAVWCQSILFSNGWEIRLHFRDVEVEEAQAILPPPHPDAIAPPATSVPQTAP